MTDGHLSGGRRKRGFTLVELVVVLVVIGALAAISLPRFAEFDTHRRVRLVARKIAGDVAYAQHLARLKGGNQSVQFVVNSDYYELTGVQDLDQPRQVYRVTLSDEPYMARITSASFGGNGTVAFNLYGVPDSGGIVVVQRGRYGLILRLDPETGEVSVSELKTSKPMPIQAI